MTLAIAHHENGRGILDALREFRPPFSPEAVVADCVALLKSYTVTEVVGDRYAGEWPREQFANLGVSHVVSEKVKSDIYRDTLPLLNSGRVELLEAVSPRTFRRAPQLPGLLLTCAKAPTALARLGKPEGGRPLILFATSSRFHGARATTARHLRLPG